MQKAKNLVQSFYQAFDKSKPCDLEAVMATYCSSNYTWRGCYPFVQLESARLVCQQFWKPLRQALTNIQRRQDIFMAGKNSVSEDNSIWVVSMGHLMGLHDNHWLNIPPTRKMAFLRYCEFHQVKDGKICQSAMWFDIPQLMVQAGVNPFPPQTGAELVQPGPMTHQGVMLEEQDPAITQKTLDTMNSMLNMCTWKQDLTLEEELAVTWHDDMIWWGPTGIGASYTIKRYIKQHSGAMRKAFVDRVFHGHVCRMAEGYFGGWFGWPNLTLTPIGGFMGMPSSNKPCDMRVVDIYRRDGDKLAENWVFIDMLHFWKQQGLDILERLKSMRSAL